eukprot:6054496-Pyramimonas_sp.AAC.1
MGESPKAEEKVRASARLSVHSGSDDQILSEASSLIGHVGADPQAVAQRVGRTTVDTLRANLIAARQSAVGGPDGAASQRPDHAALTRRKNLGRQRRPRHVQTQLPRRIPLAPK